MLFAGRSPVADVSCVYYARVQLWWTPEAEGEQVR